LAPTRQTGNPAEFLLTGSWTLIGKQSRKKVGSLRADGTYFTLALQEPRIDLRSVYQQAPDGGFRSTTLDKQVIIIEGVFENKDQMTLRVGIKELGKPAIESYDMAANREP